MTAALLSTETGNGAGTDDLDHIVCDCDEDRALCGLDVSTSPWSDGGLDCVVCAELDDLPCERCGT